MTMKCCVFGCKEKYKIGGPVTFHSLPKDEVRRKKWEIFAQPYPSTAGTLRICSKHFEDKCFDTEKLGGTWLKSDAVPTILLKEEPVYITGDIDCNDNLLPSTYSDVVCCKVEKQENDPLPCQNLIKKDDVNATNSSQDQVTKKESKKRKSFVGDFDEKDMESPEEAKKLLQIARNTIENNAKKIKILNQNKRRLEKQVEHLKKMVIAMKNKSFVSNTVCDVLQLQQLLMQHPKSSQDEDEWSASPPSDSFSDESCCDEEVMEKAELA